MTMSRGAFVFYFILLVSQPLIATKAWSNGGYSTDPANPDYGTHDWIAQHALDWLPASEKQYLSDNLQRYLYGTELPDNSQAPDGIGDSGLHHIYYSASGSLQDSAAAVRAGIEYQTALNYLKAGNSVEAAKHAGAMTHYIADVAVFGHVMGASTDWGVEKHHSDYENHVNGLTTTYSDIFQKPLHFDGSLANLTASDAAKQVAYDTSFNGGGQYTAVWMDKNYDWSSSAFKDRSWESLNLAVNRVADVLSSLYEEYANAAKAPTTITCFSQKTVAKLDDIVTISGKIDADIDATVTLLSSADGGATWQTVDTATSTHGYYSIGLSLLSGTYAIIAQWPGDATFEGASSQVLNLTFLPPSGNLKIILKDDQNAPVAGATITAYSTPQDQPPLQGTSSTEGTATFQDLLTGAYLFSVAKNGYTTQQGTATVVADTTTTTTIIIPPVVRLGSLKITLVDESGATLEDVDVNSISTPRDEHELKGKTGTDGVQTFNNIRVGAYAFNASKTGYKSNTGNVQVVEGQTTALSIVLAGSRGDISGNPTEGILLGFMVVLGYLVFFRINMKKTN